MQRIRVALPLEPLKKKQTNEKKGIAKNRSTNKPQVYLIRFGSRSEFNYWFVIKIVNKCWAKLRKH